MEDMELVIKIPKEAYKFAKECKAKGSSKYSWNLSYNDIILTIANGVSLPKGHGRLIDADDIDNHIIGHVDTRSCPTIVKAESEDK